MILENKITFTFYIIDSINDLDFKRSVKNISELIYESFSNHNKYFGNIKPCIIYDKYTFINDKDKWATLEIPTSFMVKNPYELFSDITKASYDVYKSIDKITKYPNVNEDNIVVITVNENTNINLIDKEISLRDTIDLNYIANTKFDKEIEGANDNL